MGRAPNPSAGAIALALAVGAAVAPAGAEARCKLALALGLDISSSVDAGEYALQLGGVADAFQTEALIDAILTPEGAHVAVIVYEWSGYNQQDVAIGWTVLDSADAAYALSGRLRAHRRPYVDLSTALGKAVEYGAALLNAGPACARRVLDISGDGANNDGPAPDEIRRRGALTGVTVNGLAILGDDPDPAAYYEAQLVQGPDAFVMVAEDFASFPPAMLRKLLRDVEGALILGRLP